MVKPSVFLVCIVMGIVCGGSKSPFAKKENTIALLLVASQKTLPVMVAVVEQLGGALGESGLLVLPCVAAHLTQMMENRLRWFGHVRRRPVDAPVRRLESWGTSNIVKGRGRPKKTWIKLIENDMRFLGIGESMAMESQIWRERIRVVDES
ncbi:hypothetical protein OROHE_027335 [Orobanche hederae]